MKSIWPKSVVLLVAVVLVSGALCSLDAQQGSEPAATAEDPLLIEFRELSKALEEKKQEYDRIEGEITSAAGRDKKAFEKRASELAVGLVDDVQKLAANVVAREEEGQDASGDRERVAEMLQRVSRSARDAIGRLEAEMGELREQHEAAAPEDAVEIEDQFVAVDAQLNRTLEMLLEQIEVMDAFGLDTGTAREFLEPFLVERAALQAGRIELTREDLTALERRLEASPDDAALLSEFELMRQRLDGHVADLDAAAGMMESLEIDTADYRQLLFEVTGEITTELMSRDVLAGLLSTWTGNAVDWVTTNLPGIFFKIVLFLLILLLFRFLSRISRKVVRKAIQTSSLKVSKLLERTALSVTGAAVMIFGILVAMSQLGIEVGPLLAGLGVVGFIIGFALQDTLGNFAAGVMILLYRPYDVGDLIEVAGGTGKVNQMSLVATTILTLDHQTLVIPNSKIWGDVIKNVTAQKERRIDMVFGISYSDDIPHAERVLGEILGNHEKVLEDPEPMVRLHNLGESSVDFVVRPWVKTEDYWDVYWDVTREVKIRFDAEGISIPFPQRDVHVIEEKATESA
jgi:small conductance mechanosensitive channel